MWGHVGISIGNRNFLFFLKQSYYRMDGRADLGLFYIFFEAEHLNMNNIFWNFGAFTLKGKEFLKTRPLVCSPFQGKKSLVVLICRRRWFSFSVFFAVATVAREADLSKLAPTTILLFL